MLSPVCLSPLRFYANEDWQNHKKSYAFGHVSPILEEANTIPSFQFVVPDDIYLVEHIYFHSIDGTQVIDGTQEMRDAGLNISEIDGHKLIIFPGEIHPDIGLTLGEYTIEIIVQLDNQDARKHYYSEVICYTNNLDDCVEIRYRNNTGNFYLKNGVVSFDNNRFLFRLFLKTEIGKPEYTFEEEATKRLGYNFIESQVSKKVYKFNVVVPEYICDAMRIIRLCDSKLLICKGQTYDMLSFDMDVDWQTQGDLASVTCEFEVDNIITNLGGFIPEETV